MREMDGKMGELYAWNGREKRIIREQFIVNSGDPFKFFPTFQKAIPHLRADYPGQYTGQF